MAFIAFMASGAGRVARIIAGLALIGFGLLALRGAGGVALAVVGRSPWRRASSISACSHRCSAYLCQDERSGPARRGSRCPHIAAYPALTGVSSRIAMRELEMLVAQDAARPIDRDGAGSRICDRVSVLQTRPADPEPFLPCKVAAALPPARPRRRKTCAHPTRAEISGVAVCACQSLCRRCIKDTEVQRYRGVR